MSKLTNKSAVRSSARSLVLVAFALLPTPALAQYIGRGAPPPLPPAPRAGQVETPAASLARSLRTLAQNPRDFTALIAAGRAALDLGDMQSAIGFFGQAEEIRPSDPAPKIGMGAAIVATGNASGALTWFYQAQQLGATPAAIGADRGLAQDLLGNQSAAQLDYRAAIGGREADEARRRLALSLGISGDRNGAFSILQPLLMRRDPAAQRIRAFVLALVGDERGASTAIDSAMPGSGSRMASFFRLLPSLSSAQKAAAVHLGIFPDPSQIRIAALSPGIVAAPPATRRETVAKPAAGAPTSVFGSATPKRAITPPRVTVVDADDRSSVSAFKFKRRETRIAEARPVARAAPPPRSAPAVTPPAVSAAAPGFSPVPASSVASTPIDPAVSPPQPGFLSREAVPVTSAAVDQPRSEPLNVDLADGASDAKPATEQRDAPDAELAAVAASGDRLSGIDRLLAQADELPVPPAPRPQVEKAPKSVQSAKAKKAAELKKAAEAKKLADAKEAAEEKKVRESLGIAGTNWVQLAGGANADRMNDEYRRLSAKSSALRKKGGAVTAGKVYFRLLTGPFPSKGEAQSFVNQLARDGVDGFSWTRTPATIKIEKLSPK